MRIVFPGKIVSFLLLGMLIGVSLMGQRKMGNIHHFDMRRWNLGFTMGANYNFYDMTSQVNLYDPEVGIRLKRVIGKPKPGLTLGLITNLNLGNNFDLRFVPSVSLEQRDFDFVFISKQNGEDSIRTKKIEASYLNLPFFVKFKSNFYDRYRAYVMAGIQLSINLASTKKVANDPDLLKTKTTDISFVFAWGFDMYGDKLKLAPEIKYSVGLTNIYLPKNTRFHSAITDLLSQTLVLSLNFE